MIKNAGAWGMLICGLMMVGILALAATCGWVKPDGWGRFVLFSVWAVATVGGGAALVLANRNAGKKQH